MTTLKWKIFDLLTPPQGLRVSIIQNNSFHGALCSIPINLICIMTTYRFFSFTFWPHPWGRGCFCGLNIDYYVDACFFPFNLICNMTIFWKSWILPPLRSWRCVKGQNICFHGALCSIPFNLICNICTTFRKNSNFGLSHNY